MPLLLAAHIQMHYGGPLLVDDVTVKVEPGDCIGMIGQNGCGKSTLLNILAGNVEPTSGRVARQRGTTVAVQEQELTYRPDATLYAEMQAVFGTQTEIENSMRDLEARIADTSDERGRERLLKEYERLQHRQERQGVYDVDRRIESMLQSLGFAQDVWHQPVEKFSGGEQNVIGLARVLLAEPDVMLLDEPSNHLDMEGVEWFIDFVRRSKAAVVMVSHNRHLLDATAKEIWEMRRAKVKSWTGNYSDFQRQKAEALALQERQYKSQQRLIKRIEFQARRLRDMASAYDDPGQAKRAKSMLKRIEQMDKVERPDTGERRFHASMAGAKRHGRIALNVRDFDFAYGDRVIFDKARLEIEYGDRVCLVGPNGSGKTTLFREILEHGSWESPTLRIGKSVHVGEYRQFHDVLDHDAKLEDWMQQATGLDRPKSHDLLYRFLFTRDDLERRISTLSGGEKSRLQLARLVHEKVNFLLLDEPTNHLDIQACEQLEEMLQDFDGTLLLISHDRYFLDKLVDRVVEVEDRGLRSHRMTFAEWWMAKQAARTRKRKGALRDRHKEADGKDDARKAFAERKEQRRTLNRLKTRYRDLEDRIARMEERQGELERRVETAFAPGGDPKEGEQLVRDIASVRDEIARLYVEWEEVGAELETMPDVS